MNRGQGTGDRDQGSEKKDREKKKLSVVCSWCGKVLVDAGPDAPVSHGICPQCKDAVMKTEMPQVRPTPRQWLTVEEEPIPWFPEAA